MSGIVFVTPPQSLSFQWLAGGFTVMLCSLSVMTFQDTGRYWKWYRKWASSETKLSALIGPLFITNKVADSHYAFIRCRQYVWILFHRELNCSLLWLSALRLWMESWQHCGAARWQNDWLKSEFKCRFRFDRVWQKLKNNYTHSSSNSDKI